MYSNGQYVRQDFNSAEIAPTQKRGVFPQFYMKPVKDEKSSAEAGRPIFKDAEFVDIRIAGDAKTVLTEKVRDEHRHRFAAAYDQFRRGVEQVADGTPLDEWPQISRSQALNLKSLNILTVEQVAELSDTALQNVGMGSRDLRAKAQAYVARAKDSAVADRMAAENQSLRDQIALMQAQIAELAARDDDDKPRRGPGRPRKED